MSQLDALRLVEKMRDRAVSLATAENYVRDSKIASRAEAIWSGPGREGGLVSELWIQGAFPSKQSDDSLTSRSEEHTSELQRLSPVRKIPSRAEAIWSGPGREGGLVSELWIQGAFPSKQSDDSLTS